MPLPRLPLPGRSLLRLPLRRQPLPGLLLLLRCVGHDANVVVVGVVVVVVHDWISAPDLLLRTTVDQPDHSCCIPNRRLTLLAKPGQPGFTTSSCCAAANNHTTISCCDTCGAAAKNTPRAVADASASAAVMM